MYNSNNKLRLISKIQNIAKEHLKDDRSYKWIWRNKVYPIYFIGYTTFMNYMGVSRVKDKLDMTERGDT